jgi:phosphate transport system substrate-binding protein
MKHLFVLALGTIALCTLPSCTAPTPPSATIAPAPAASPSQASIKIGGSSSTANLLSLLENKFTPTAPNIKITQLEPGQSESIIEGIKLKVVDVGGISKSALEVKKKDKALEAREIAQDLLLVATHPSVVGVKNLTTDHLKGIYSGTIKNWQEIGGPDAPIVLLDRPEDESAKRLLRKHYLGADLQNSPEAVVFRKEGELIQAIQATPYSIGAFSRAYAIGHQLTVHRLSLNGFAPTPESFKAGNYPMVRQICLVWHTQPSEATQRLIQYIASPPAISAMAEAGFIPMTTSGQP